MEEGSNDLCARLLLHPVLRWEHMGRAPFLPLGQQVKVPEMKS